MDEYYMECLRAEQEYLHREYMERMEHAEEDDKENIKDEEKQHNG